MFDELTEVDIKEMKEELEYRITKLRPEILEEVKLTRSYGDLSENAEERQGTVLCLDSVSLLVYNLLG